MGKPEWSQCAEKILHRSSRLVASVSIVRGHNVAWKLQGEHLARYEDCGKVTAERSPRVPRTHENHLNNQPNDRTYLGCVVCQYAPRTFSITSRNCLPSVAHSRLQNRARAAESSTLAANSWPARTMDWKRVGQRRRSVWSDAVRFTIDADQPSSTIHTDSLIDSSIACRDWTDCTNNECTLFPCEFPDMSGDARPVELCNQEFYYVFRLMCLPITHCLSSLDFTCPVWMVERLNNH